LYACIFDGRAPDAVMAGLHAYAAARDWTVTAALYDMGPLDTPGEVRRALTRVARLLEDGAVDGLVTRSEADLAASSKLGKARLTVWLASLGHPVFVDYLQKAPESVDDRGLRLDEAVRPAACDGGAR
ncbi:hypothetical protein ABZ404_39135, partial [Streptomyces sp. NPDC005878]|uniref:hypothetical protein n=1 Tax=Streptomyces sp. NPDC005878 TaxID=3157077 RepID=UPI0033FA9A45